MKQDPLITKRFEELIHNGGEVLATYQHGSGFLTDYVDSKVAEEWATSSISFIGRVLGRDSEHYIRFKKHYEQISHYGNSVRAVAVLKAAYEDYKGGYLFDTVKRIQAEIFDDFLEQADYFLKGGYHGVAAVLAGAVLEDTLRKLCDKKEIPIGAQPKLDAMNADLAKSGFYDKLIQKKITWLADVRNKAAHGKWTEFSPADAEEMLRGVRRIAEDYI